jgi:hypothetical protein
MASTAVHASFHAERPPPTLRAHRKRGAKTSFGVAPGPRVYNPAHLRSWSLAALVAAAVFLIGEIPYAAGRAASPPEHRFCGLVSWPDDLNMYFSFARQAAAGHWLFENRLTHLPHGRVFFNPEFLAVGWLMRWCGLEGNAAFEIWRAGGVLALVVGFMALCGAVAVPRGQRMLALLLFVLGGGVGWLAVLLGIEGLRLDLRMAFQPFAQMLLNPNFSLPHGLLLAFMAAFLLGERSGRIGWYLAAGGIVLLEILIRPYDLLTLWIAVPAFVLLAHPQTVSAALLRLLPLLFTLPAAAYFFFLFRMHPVFRQWASQGQMEPVSITDQVACLGLMALIAAWRLARSRALPLTVAERFLLAWLVAEIGIVHLWRVSTWLPFSPQVGLPVMAPVVLLALPAFPAAAWSGLALPARAALAALVAINSVSSGVLLRQRASIVTTQISYYHLPTAALEAFAWLRTQAGPEDVILADYIEGNRLGRFVSARVVLGHYSVTPEAAAVDAGVKRLLSGQLGGEDARRLLDAWRVRWVYYSLKKYPQAALDEIPRCARRYRRQGIVIYECGAPAGARP